MSPDLNIDNIQIERVQKTKFLGVIINQSLTWTDHISLVKQKITKSIGVILRIRKTLPTSILRTLYFSLIHPHYEYCNIVWAIHRSTALNDIFLTQKSFTNHNKFTMTMLHQAALQ